MYRIIAFALALGMTLAATHAFAQEGRRHGGARPSFAELDTDGDGYLSLTEFTEGRNRRAEKVFEKLDADGDELVSEAELADARERFQERRRGR